VTVTTCLGDNADAACRAVVAYLDEQLPGAYRFVGDISWQERERRLDANRIDVGWICGAYYVAKAAAAPERVRLLAAPVMDGARYGNRPIYFSDVVVRADSRFHSFASLRGARWAYNERRSFSGYIAVCQHLAELGLDGSYFGAALASGAHVESLRMVLAGEVEATAIDSTLLDDERARRPDLRRRLRVVHSLGPSPIPPWVAFGGLSATDEERLRTALLALPTAAAGRAALAAGNLARFAPVADADYEPIRAAVRIAQSVSLG
jgi:phosphonate transport system substrate-binding protein